MIDVIFNDVSGRWEVYSDISGGNLFIQSARCEEMATMIGLKYELVFGDSGNHDYSCCIANQEKLGVVLPNGRYISDRKDFTGVGVSCKEILLYPDGNIPIEDTMAMTRRPYRI